MHNIRKLPSLIGIPWLAETLTVMGAVAYAFQSLFYARVLPTMVDEGSYLIKGYLFATGQYIPYEPYGVWTNHMPLSFLIPGYIQAWFGPGLRAGRYLSIVLGIVMLAGLWLVTRRLAGKWWALAVVWAITLNVTIIKAYSIAVSQVLVASILVWILVFALGGERKQWHLMIGSGLAGILFMTRINMSPVLPFLLAYLIWEHGWRIGVKVTIPGLLVVAIGHALYWPEILTFSRNFLPGFIQNGISYLQLPLLSGGQSSWNPDVSLTDQLNSIFSTIHLNFVPFLAIITTWILWQKRVKWKDQSKYRSAVFLSSLFTILFIEHALFTLGRNYCVFCLSGYVTFFSSLGIILLINSIPFLRQQLPKWNQYILVGFILFILIIIGYASFDVHRFEFFTPKVIHNIINTRVPRVSSLQILPGEVKLWVLFQNKFGMDFQSIYNLIQRIFSSVIIGAIAWLSTLLLAFISMKIFAREKSWAGKSYGVYLLMSLLVISMILSPTPILAKTQSTNNCEQDVLLSHEVAGELLSTLIPHGAIVYWDGGSSAVPLLYLPDIQIFPAQINGVYSRVIDGDVNILLQQGKWNKDLSERWLSEADYLLVSDYKYLHGQNYISSGIWEEVTVTLPVITCQESTALHLLKRIE